MDSIAISVIVVTYNSDKDKLIKTLCSILRQKNINFEIIVCDDGSEQFDIKYLCDYFCNVNFTDYQIVAHKKNQGTVLNYKDGLDIAKGNYIYGISPGDFLYDEYTLCSMYKFAFENNADICFGKANYYRFENNKLEQEKTALPKWAEVFSLCQNKKISDIAFFVGQQPIGASYMRKRIVAEKYFSIIAGKVKYAEDFPTTGLYLLDGNKIFYFNKPCVWYEFGSGISTNRSNVWKKRMDDDFVAATEIMFSLHPENKILQAKYNKNLLGRLKHPMICLIAVYIKIMAAIKFSRTKIDYEHKYELEQILNYKHEL